jgi:hypothetical protein
MARRPGPKDDTDPLFGLPSRTRGKHERAMEATIREWRAAGRVIDPSVSVSLRSQAAAVDLAIDKNDYWHIGNANRVLMELRHAYINDNDGPDPFDTFMSAITADEDARGEVTPHPERTKSNFDDPRRA